MASTLTRRRLALRGIALIIAGIAQTACGSSPACDRPAGNQTWVMSGTIALPDADVSSLAISVCVDTTCGGTPIALVDSGLAPSAPTVTMDGGLTYAYALTDGDIVFRQIAPGSYQVSGAITTLPVSATDAGGATLSVTIQSANTIVYQASAPAVCTTTKDACGTYAHCSFELQ
jgi:hypothetical protein